jgi:hypothetical protein
MEQDKQPKRVKNTESSAHRSGTLRGAVKPHKRKTEPSAKQIIDDYMGKLNIRLTQTVWGTSLAKSASILRANFGLAATDEPYLLLDVSSGRNGKAGMLLSTTGVHIADGQGGTAAVAWKDLPKCNIAYQNNTLVIGQTGITTRDGQVLAALLQQIKSKVSQ